MIVSRVLRSSAVYARNLPQWWWHADVVEFVDGILQNRFPFDGEIDEDTGSSHVKKVKLRYRPKSGLVSGAAIVYTSTDEIADFLLLNEHSSTVAPQMSRSDFDLSQIRFEKVKTFEETPRQKLAPAPETVLETIDLDRLVLAPDLLYDVERIRQPRYLPLGSDVRLSPFRDARSSRTPPRRGPPYIRR